MGRKRERGHGSEISLLPFPIFHTYYNNYFPSFSFLSFSFLLPIFFFSPFLSTVNNFFTKLAGVSVLCQEDIPFPSPFILSFPVLLLLHLLISQPSSQILFLLSSFSSFYLSHFRSLSFFLSTEIFPHHVGWGLEAVKKKKDGEGKNEGRRERDIFSA